MREILFRAKAINRDGGYHRTNYKNGDWVYGLIARLYDEKYLLPALMTNTEGVSGIEVDHETICQYTGLTDKNGNKIWENDVVRYYDDIADMNKEDLVKWNETHASFVRLHESKMGLQYLYIDECIANRCSVIGNIFDNPELLKGDITCLINKK